MLLDHCLATAGEHEVVFLDAPVQLVERFRAAGVNARRCEGLGSLIKYLRGRRAARPLINTHNFKGLLFGWVAATLLRLPLVITQHGFTPRSTKQRFYTWLSLQLCRTPSVRRVVCVAESIARLHRLAHVRADKLQVIPNGLPPAAEMPKRQAEPCTLVGYVGRLSREKGPDLFLDALIPLAREHSHLHAVMLGDGPERDVLQSRIDDAGLGSNIQLPGYQTEMRHWWMQLDLLVISSRTEGTPMIMLEAMQAGVPVVSFAVGGIPDVLEDGINGLLAEPANSAALAACIDRLIDDPGLARALAERARHTQQDRYHLPVLAERWSQLYMTTAQGA
ncbi:glycosyltransferase [Pseudomonas sp. R5(2019)]|nr:glycosyltransferase [Pseudomonas sp. R5(2019)]